MEGELRSGLLLFFNWVPVRFGDTSVATLKIGETTWPAEMTLPDPLRMGVFTTSGIGSTAVFCVGITEGGVSCDVLGPAFSFLTGVLV